MLSSVEHPQRLALLAVLPVLLLGAAVYIYASLRLTERQFLRSESDLAKRMSRLDEWPRGLALTFKSMPMMCHDNVWKSAVALSANVCAAVLMDLRGFSDERKGCQYEVDFLLDQVPADRIVFLIDPQDAERVQALILESWNALKITSPNLTRAAPRIALYVASDQDDKDIQGILDQLLHAARADAPRGAGARQSTADAAMQGGPRRAAESAHALTPVAGSAESGT